MNSDYSEPADLWLATPEAADRFRAESLSRAEADRYARMRSERKRRDFAVSRALRGFLQLDKVPLGTLSHSGAYAVVLRMDRPVSAGVDVETHAIRRFESLAHFAYSAAEADVIERAPADERARLFYALWTLKEAFAKALRLPLLEATRSCTFLPSEGALRGRVPVNTPWTARVFEPRPDVSVAIAILDARIALRVYEWPPGAERHWPEPFAVHPDGGDSSSR